MGLVVLLLCFSIFCSNFCSKHQVLAAQSRLITGGAPDDILEQLLDYGRIPRAPPPISSQENDVDYSGPQNQLKFPILTRSEAKFAVNPRFESYYEQQLKPAELEVATKQDNDEIAEDPLKPDDDDDKRNKKATYPRHEALTQESAESERRQSDNDIYFITIVAVCSALTVFSIAGAGFCYHRVQKNSRASEEVEYPAYGVTGPGKEISPASGDRKLAQSAQMYHYQHQKQQMIAFDRNAGIPADRRSNGSGATAVVGGGGAAGGPVTGVAGVGGGSGGNGHNSDAESEDGEEGDYTVYECPGLAPTGEMEVRNPLFQDETTPKNSSGN